jgi:hypothetical protein
MVTVTQTDLYIFELCGQHCVTNVNYRIAEWQHLKQVG